MPELPEVEVSRQGIAPYLEGKVVARIEVRQPKLRWPVPEAIQQMVGQPILKVQRRAKYLLLLTPEGTAILHLGMSGSVRILPASHPIGKHDHVDIVMASGQLLRLNDPRRFGALLWQTGPVESHPLLAKLGPEPLTDAFTAERLYQASRQRKMAIKTFLMDNHQVVGVGNIYANEALFAAGILPSRAAGQIALPRYQRLVTEVKRVLAAAIKQGGTTLKDFTKADGKPGYFVQALQVYGRGGEPCQQCGQPLKESRIGQRTTVYCTRCQR